VQFVDHSLLLIYAVDRPLSIMYLSDSPDARYPDLITIRRVFIETIAQFVVPLLHMDADRIRQMMDWIYQS